MAAVARLRPAALALGVLGAGLAAGGLFLAACCSAPASSSALGGGREEGSGDELRPFQGENLTAGEITEIEKAFRRRPMAQLPTAVTDLPATLPYRPDVYRQRTALHIGQRKLLLSEVDFLTDYARKGDTVVYAGSAPGIHLPYLASLFHSKALRFELYDPRKFSLPKGRAEANARIASSSRTKRQRPMPGATTCCLSPT